LIAAGSKKAHRNRNRWQLRGQTSWPTESPVLLRVMIVGGQHMEGG
jgi:hypothetical protein